MLETIVPSAVGKGCHSSKFDLENREEPAVVGTMSFHYRTNVNVCGVTEGRCNKIHQKWSFVEGSRKEGVDTF